MVADTNGVTVVNANSVSDSFIVITAGVGLFLSTLDTGIINVAMPTLVSVFHSTVSGIAWTVTLYTLALTGTIIIFGRLSDRYGHVKVYVWGLVVFALSSTFCGFSHSSTELILFRTMQGIGAAMLQATSAAIITTMIPRARQGAALGTLGVLMGLGPVLGPSVGGVLISLASWRWMFWINIPMAIFALLGCQRMKKAVREKPKPIRPDIPGNVLLSFSVLALLESLSEWSVVGASNVMTISSFALFVILFVTFVLRESRIADPIIDLRLFRKGDFSVSVLAVFFFGGATSLGFVIPPYFLESVRHFAPWQSGFVNLSAPVGLMLLSKVSGTLMGRMGTKPLMAGGLILMVLSYGTLSQMRAGWSPFLLAALLFVYGVGSGLFVPANLAAIMGATGQESQGTIAAVQRMVQNLGIAVDTAVAAALIRIHAGSGMAGLMAGFREAWGYATVTLVASLALFLLILVRTHKRRQFIYI